MQYRNMRRAKLEALDQENCRGRVMEGHAPSWPKPPGLWLKAHRRPSLGDCVFAAVERSSAFRMGTAESIATYRETRFDGKRVFELFPDRVHVRGNIQLSSDFEASVPLVGLNPNPTRIRIRHKSFVSGLWILLVSAVLDTVLVSSFHVPPESFPVVLIGCLGMSGFVLMLATFRKVEYVSFANVAGVQVLAFARSGPDAGSFDSFVQLIQSNISNAARGT